MQTCLKKNVEQNTTSRSRDGGAKEQGREGVKERSLSRRVECIKNSKCPTPNGQRLPAINTELCGIHTNTHTYHTHTLADTEKKI